MCPRLSANYVSCCPPNMAQVSVWADNLHLALPILQSNEECINRILTSRKEYAKIVNRTAYTIYACGLDKNVSDRKCLIYHVQDLIGLLPCTQSQV